MSRFCVKHKFIVSLLSSLFSESYKLNIDYLELKSSDSQEVVIHFQNHTYTTLSYREICELISDQLKGEHELDLTSQGLLKVTKYSSPKKFQWEAEFTLQS